MILHTKSTQNTGFLYLKVTSFLEATSGQQLILAVLEKLSVLETKLLAIEHNNMAVKNLPKWHSVSDVAKAKGLTSDAIRKQLQNGEFEYGVDFKHNGGKILIHQGAVGRLHRRRSSNG